MSRACESCHHLVRKTEGCARLTHHLVPMRLISWNRNGRRGTVASQATALLDRDPDVVALQEVTQTSLPMLRDALRAGGLIHTVEFHASSDNKGRSAPSPLAGDHWLSDVPGLFGLFSEATGKLERTYFRTR